MTKMKTRTAVNRDAGFQTRSEGENKYIEGYFAVFNSRYDLWDGAYETILPGAFDGETERDVRALANHDTAMVLGRTTAGTLELSVDDRGLFGRILINPNDQDAMNVYERVKRGDISQCSFGFNIDEEEIEYGEDGSPDVWKIKHVRLFEVSVVTFPAYEDTAVQARMDDKDQIMKRKKENWQKEILKKLRGENKDA